MNTFMTNVCYFDFLLNRMIKGGYKIEAASSRIKEKEK